MTTTLARMLRKKTMPAYLVRPWEAFQRQAQRVEQARRALLGCLPIGRIEPAPVTVGLDLLADELAAVKREAGGWHTPEISEHWQRCWAALDEALAGVPRARAVAERSSELEELLDAVGEVVEPLDAYAEAWQAWLRLRVRH